MSYILQDTQRWRSCRGNALAAVLMFCMALLVVSTAFFQSMASNRRISNRTELLMQARQGAEAALGFATAEFNKRATSLSAISDNPLSGYSLSTAEKDFLSGSSTDNNIVASSIEFKSGKVSATKTDMILFDNDPAYTGDQAAGLSMAVRSGYVYAKASTLDPVLGTTHTAYVSGVIQVREQTWLNYGMFYNMDMEFYPGVAMNVQGAVHTNADMYLSAAGASATVNFYKKVTAAGHIYKGLKYTISAFNTDGTAKGFTAAPSGFTSAEGAGRVYISKDGSTLVEMTGTKDCLGTKTIPSANTATWITAQTSDWKKYVMDSSLSVEQFTPPGLPLYVPEDLSTTATTERRNHAYAMIEPQLPATDTTRYYGRKSDAVEDLKFSAMAGMTIVVDDLDLTGVSGVSTLNSALPANGFAIPWKLVWYEGSVLANQPLSKENLPTRDGTTKLPVPYTIDPFALNDEVDRAENLITSDTDVKMRRNLKALLRDAIVVVPYHDSGNASTFGTGTVSVNINSYPTTAASFAITAATALTAPGGSWTRYNQPAGAWPSLNASDTTTYNWIYYGQAAAAFAANTDRYPDYATATDAASAGTTKLNSTTARYSGHYDRRQGHTRSGTTSTYNNGLRGAQHVVYIDLQKLNWILNNAELWKHPITGDAIYNFDKTFTNIIYVDLPSKAKDTTRFALTDSDKVCSAATPTATVPGYAVFLDRGARLPRLAYNESLRTPGFTLATNGPLYLMGNFNADGITGTGDSILPDSTNWYSSTYPDAFEIPALVAADAVTWVSEKYSLKISNKGKVSATADTTKPETADNGNNGSASTPQYYRHNGYNGDTTQTTDNFQEISTAMITGLVPTIPYLYTQSPYSHPTVTYSGSVNNLPRFLESYSGKSTRYRGSMAALYESEVSTACFYEGPHAYWFGPPPRDWGYHQYLAAAKYPPGTPVLRTTRMIGVKDITAAEYAAAVPQPP